MARPSSRPEAAVRSQLTVLRLTLPAAALGDVDAVHKARVATRRLRERLAVFGEQGRRQRRLQRQLQSIGTVLGVVRELDVAIEDLDWIGQSSRVSAAGLSVLRVRIEAERRPGLRKLRRVVRKVDLRSVRRRALKCVQRPGRASSHDRAHGVARAWSHAARRALLLRRAIEEAGYGYVPDRVHAVRIAVKKLKYALEAVGETGRARPPAGVARLRQAQDLLGRVHDLEVLAARARAAAAESADLQTLDALETVAARLERECAERHGRYLRMRAGLLAVCDRAERTSSRRKET